MSDPTRGLVTGQRGGRQVTDESLEAKFGSRVTVRSDGCWAWLGHLDNYGRFRVSRGVTVAAHHFAYATLVGEFPKGYHLHHKCQHPGCVNPEHLEPLTPKEHKAAHRLLDAC